MRIGKYRLENISVIKSKLLQLFFAMLTIVFLGLTMYILYIVIMETINKGLGFFLWLTSLIACLCCSCMAWGYYPKFLKGRIINGLLKQNQKTPQDNLD